MSSTHNKSFIVCANVVNWLDGTSVIGMRFTNLPMQQKVSRNKRRDNQKYMKNSQSMLKKLNIDITGQTSLWHGWYDCLAVACTSICFLWFHDKFVATRWAVALFKKHNIFLNKLAQILDTGEPHYRQAKTRLHSYMQCSRAWNVNNRVFKYLVC